MNWYYLDQSGKVQGPISEQAVRELIAAGAITETTPICPKGSQEWTTFSAAYRQDHTGVGQHASKPVTTSTFKTKIRNMPTALKIGAGIGVAVIAIGLIGLVVLFAVVGAANQANQSAQQASLDPVASIEAEFGLKLDRDTAYIYVMGYQMGSKGASEMVGLETPQPVYDQMATTILLNNPDLSAEQRKLAEAGLQDGKAGRPNRLEGIDIESLAVARAPIKRTLSDYCSQGDLTKVTEMATRSNVNQADEYSNLPLHSACYKGHIDIVRHLLSLGARIDRSDGSGEYPIHKAAKSGNLELFISLLESGAKIDQKTDISAEFNKDRQSAGLLRSIGKDPNPGAQPIHSAAESGSLSICQYLVKRGISPDVKDNNGLTPLHYATNYKTYGELNWISSNAEVIRMFDPEGKIEKKHRMAIGPSGSSIRTSGIYLRILKNTGKHAINDGKPWIANVLELGENGTASVMIATADTKPQPSDVIRAFRSPTEGSIYKGFYKLSGENLDFLRVDLYSIPEERYRLLRGPARGDSLNLKFMSMEEGMQDQYFGDSTDSRGKETYDEAFKFYPG